MVPMVLVLHCQSPLATPDHHSPPVLLRPHSFRSCGNHREAHRPISIHIGAFPSMWNRHGARHVEAITAVPTTTAALPSLPCSTPTTVRCPPPPLAPWRCSSRGRLAPPITMPVLLRLRRGHPTPATPAAPAAPCFAIGGDGVDGGWQWLLATARTAHTARRGR